MTGYRKWQTTSLTFSLLLLGFLIISCEKEKEKPKAIVATVGNSILTEERLDSLLTFSQNKNKYREEIIRDWVDSEILYMEASHEGVTEDDEYIQLVKSSNKKLAAALYLEEKLDDEPVDMNETLLDDYFYSNQDDFKIAAKAYAYNKAVFNDESKAILFRNTLNESDWNKAANVFQGNNSVLLIGSEIFKYVYEISSKKEGIILDVLKKGEVSIIFETNYGEYSIVQLVSKYEAGTIPDFRYIKKNVIDQYVSSQKAKNYEELMQNLYSKYDVIINR